MIRQARLKVFGIVQGVFFRHFISQHARNLNLVGFAENLNDGTVKVVVEGEEEDIQRLIEIAMEGPRGAHIQDIKVEWFAASGQFSGFEIR